METNAYAHEVKRMIIDNPAIQDRDELATMAQNDMINIFADEWKTFMHKKCSKPLTVAEGQANKLVRQRIRIASFLHFLKYTIYYFESNFSVVAGLDSRYIPSLPSF